MNLENIIGKVRGLDGLIDYQPGAVVSRTLIDKPAGTITLFAFDRGQGLSEHTAPYDAKAGGDEYPVRLRPGAGLKRASGSLRRDGRGY